MTVRGGGTTGQAGAIRHGLSRALLQADADFRPVLKKAGFLTRDPRMKEERNTVSRQLVALRSSASANLTYPRDNLLFKPYQMVQKPRKSRLNSDKELIYLSTVS